MSPPQSLIWLRALPADASEFVVFFRLSRARTFVRARSLVVRSLVRPRPPQSFFRVLECSAQGGVRACDVRENPSFTCFLPRSISIIVFYLTTYLT
jgi:hypothetical protein